MCHIENMIVHQYVVEDWFLVSVVLKKKLQLRCHLTFVPKPL